MTYVFDVDGTVCTLTDGDYLKAEPLTERIEKIKQLYDEGHKIFFHTARGMGRTGNSQMIAHQLFYHLTLSQLREWGIEHHGLIMGKPSGDVYIDDKGVKDEDFFNSRD